MCNFPRIEKLIHSSSWNERLKGVEEIIEILKTLPDENIVEQLGDLLLELVNDPKWEVRKTIPLAAVYFDEDLFYQLINPLLKDHHAYVSQTANQILKRRARLSGGEKRQNREYEDINRILEVIAGRTNPEIKKLAVRLKDLARETAIGEVYHEIQKLLTPIPLWIENLQEKPNQKQKMTDEMARLLWNIDEQTKLIAGALIAIKKYNEASADDHQIENLAQIIKKAIKTATDDYVSRPTRYKYEIINELPSHIQVYGNREDLKMAFSNIILNGLEALDKNGRVHISARQGKDDQLELEIRDTGRGMTENMIRTAGNLFRSMKKGHIGMGVPLAKKIIKQEHQGEIQIESRRGEGTVVKIVLPGKPSEESV